MWTGSLIMALIGGCAHGNASSGQAPAMPAPQAQPLPTVFTQQAHEMLAWLHRVHDGESGEALSADLARILRSTSYARMFQHYNASWRPHHLPPTEFHAMLLGLRGEPSASTNGRIEQMRPRWRAALTQIDALQRDLGALERLLQQGLVRQAVEAAARWLPVEDMGIPVSEVHVYLDGGSFPWALDHVVGLDLLQLPKSTDGVRIDLEALEPLLAHEFHHIGLAAWRRGRGVCDQVREQCRRRTPLPNPAASSRPPRLKARVSR